MKIATKELIVLTMPFNTMVGFLLGIILFTNALPWWIGLTAILITILLCIGLWFILFA